MSSKLRIILGIMIFITAVPIAVNLDSFLIARTSAINSNDYTCTLFFSLVYIGARLYVTGMASTKWRYPPLTHLHIFPDVEELNVLTTKLKWKISAKQLSIILIVWVTTSYILNVRVVKTVFAETYHDKMMATQLLSQVFGTLVISRLLLRGASSWFHLQDRVTTLEKRSESS